ncbi:proprotein convertase subtilisin/kexin type 6-like [Mercenaria mercenaria]|uniref:proprotein convertase subtilisin/kexin type 6-like n=1 Tax=Mercenaria mercenaria TaxID=6596 RepID=UPI00234E4C32|nr:proprotein convertase subtilisin/kexin type 6-like [Mercenaria mercenaria]
MWPESDSVADHGNKVASIVAATKGNNLCSAGIAHDTTFAALKIFGVKSFKGIVELHPKHSSQSDITSKALTHRLDKIDIFVNAWRATNTFDHLDLATREALAYGVGSGRNGLGAIYTFPAGPVGNGLSNTNNTITVNGIGINGTIPDGALTDASVLTSGLWQGNNLTASDMVTTTRNNRCITSFKGVSAAVAQVSAMIGLGLEANPNLTVRDVKHLLVRSSEHRRLKETISFSRNDAGHHFHGIFGFGLLNASKFVSQAKRYMGTPKLEIQLLELSKKRTRGRHTHEFKFCHSCDFSDVKGCLTTIEYVSVKLHFQTSTKLLKAEIVSPRNTHSVLMDVSIDKQNPPVSVETTLFSAHFWDEFAFGNWILKIHSHLDTSETTIRHVSLMLYGTTKSNVASEIELTFCDKYFSNTSKSPQPTTAQPQPESAHKEAQGLSGGVIALIICASVVVVVVFLISIICYNRRRINTSDTLPSDQSVPRLSQQLDEIDINENNHAQEENSLLDGAERDDDEMMEEENNKT